MRVQMFIICVHRHKNPHPHDAQSCCQLLVSNKPHQGRAPGRSHLGKITQNCRIVAAIRWACPGAHSVSYPYRYFSVVSELATTAYDWLAHSWSRWNHAVAALSRTLFMSLAYSS